MRRLVAAVRMIYSCAFIALYLIIVGTPVLTYCRIARNPRLALYLTWILDRMVLFQAGVRVQAEGLEKLKSGQGYIFIANHRSFIDILALFKILPGDFRFLGKKEVFKIPAVGFALRTMGMIEVDRSDHEAATRSIERAAGELSAGRSITLFPEGTRSRMKTMLPFKKGAFVLAIQAQVPIVPITILGADYTLQPDTMQLLPGTVRIIIHDPIETKGLTLDDRGDLLERARKVIEEPLMSGLAQEAVNRP